MRIDDIPARAWPWLAFAVVMLAQLPLVLNPGYFSHDELQWAAHAEQGSWVSWTAFDTFQYRPLTFNLWQWLSLRLFTQPYAFHAVLVALGALNAALAAQLMGKLGVRAATAFCGAAAFALGPYAAYVHGWVGTLGDLVWVGCGLAVAVAARARLREPALAVIAATLTVAALLAKEAAVVIPALLALAWWLLPRDRRWAVAAAATAVPVAAYLALRFGALMDAPRSGGQYSLSLVHAPARWLEYQVFAFNPTLFETHNTFMRGWTDPRTLVAALTWLAVVAALARTGWRWAFAFVAGGIAALGPVLVLASASNQYAYGYAAVTAVVAAAAWPHAPRWGRAVLAFALLLVLWHGVNVMRQVRDVGVRQAVFSPAVADVLSSRGDAPLRLRAQDRDRTWVYQRLIHGVPSYRGVAMGDRVRLAEPGEDADYLIANDGSLQPAD
jgi:hypothetical protein